MAKRDSGIESITFKAGDGPEVRFESMEELGASDEFRAGVAAAIGAAAGDDPKPELAQFGKSASQDADAREWSRLIPGSISFVGAEFQESSELAELAEELIERYGELGHLRDYRVRVLWKAEGGGTGGNDTLGKCIKPGGPARYFALCDWVIWLAADHCRERRFDDRQVEALLYHELKHCVLVGKDSKPGTRGHDFEVFGDEIERYGFWNTGRQALAKVVQGRLELDGEG